jgi:hypothetical protein
MSFIVLESIVSENIYIGHVPENVCHLATLNCILI